MLGFAFFQDRRGIGSSLVAVVKAAFAPKLLLLFGLALLYSFGVVYAAWLGGLWHLPALKETVYWFIGTGVALVALAISPGASTRQLLRRVLRRILAATVVIEFVANLYAFPLSVELPLTFVLLVFVMLQAYGPDESDTPRARA